MTAQVFAVVQRIASNLFQVPPDQIVPSSSPEGIQAWDSVQQLNLVLALEQEFNVQFEPEELDRIHCIGDIVRVLEQKVRFPS